MPPESSVSFGERSIGCQTDTYGLMGRTRLGACCGRLRGGDQVEDDQGRFCATAGAWSGTFGVPPLLDGESRRLSPVCAMWSGDGYGSSRVRRTSTHGAGAESGPYPRFGSLVGVPAHDRRAVSRSLRPGLSRPTASSGGIVLRRCRCPGIAGRGPLGQERVEVDRVTRPTSTGPTGP